MGAKRIRKGSLVRVVREYESSTSNKESSMVGALGIVTNIFESPYTHYPYGVIVGVCSAPEIDLGYRDDVHEVEHITEEDYLREYTVARLSGKAAYTLKELRQRVAAVQQEFDNNEPLHP